MLSMTLSLLTNQESLLLERIPILLRMVTQKTTAIHALRSQEKLRKYWAIQVCWKKLITLLAQFASLCLPVYTQRYKFYSEWREKYSRYFKLDVLQRLLQPFQCAKAVEMYKTDAIMFLQDAFLEENFCNNTGICSNLVQGSSLSSYRRTKLLSVMEPFAKIFSKLYQALHMEALHKITNGGYASTENGRPLEVATLNHPQVNCFFFSYIVH